MFDKIYIITPYDQMFKTLTAKFKRWRRENILNDEELMRSLKKGSADAAKKRGRFV